jgi:signal transduction histidine kinase
MGDIGRLVENIRKLHRAEDRSLHRHIIDVNALINDVVATHLNDPSGKVQITVRPGKQAPVFGNALLRDVFDNLIENAVKHSGGEVQIEVIIGRFMTEGKEFVRVAVTDTGPGISDEVKKTLFNRMQRGHTAASGRGLGLYLAKTVLEMCDGRIWVDDRFSDDPGRGARFVVLIPAADEQ